MNRLRGEYASSSRQRHSHRSSIDRDRTSTKTLVGQLGKLRPIVNRPCSPALLRADSSLTRRLLHPQRAASLQWVELLELIENLP
jgi:hypothetical protein